MNGSADMCLMFGPIVSFVVSFLKRIPFVKNNPKWVTLFFTIATGAYTATHGSPAGIDWAAILQCVLVQFSTAVATHEAVTNTITGSSKA